MCCEDSIKSECTKAVAAFINWANYGVNYIGEKYGEKEIEEYFRYIGERFIDPLLTEDVSNIIKSLYWFHCMEGSEVELVENENEIKTVVKRCNTGGRMRKEGIIGPNMREENMPWYCYHCKLWWQDMLVEKGYSFRFDYNPEGPCNYILEK